MGSCPHLLSMLISHSYSAGMTGPQQDLLIKAFSEGHHEVIVATNTAEEGLDIQACDNVVRYKYVTNMIARVQCTGRFFLQTW